MKGRSGRFRLIATAWSSSAVRYLVVGGLAFLVDIGLLYVLHELLDVDLVIATPAAFLTSFAVTYVMQRLVTFEAKGRWGVSAVKYALLVAFNTVATTFVVAGVVAMGGPWAMGKIAAVALTTLWNYFGYRYWVFAGRGTQGQ